MKDKEAFDKINEATNRLSSRVKTLIDKITAEKGELSPELAAEADAITGTLDGIAADPANPVPEAGTGTEV